MSLGWVVILGPASLTIALFLAPYITHIIMRSILQSEFPLRTSIYKSHLYNNRVLTPQGEEMEQTCEEEKIVNMYIAVFSLIVSLVIFGFLSWIYSFFAQGHAKLVAWIFVLIPMIIGIVVLVIVNDRELFKKLINPDDYGEGQGTFPIGFNIWVQLKSPLNWLRLFVLFLSYALAVVVYHYGGF